MQKKNFCWGRCFTLGEASIVCQGFIVFLYNALIHGSRDVLTKKVHRKNDQLNLVLQVVLLAVTIIVTLCHCVKVFRKTIVCWVLLTVIMGCAILCPIIDQSALMIVLKFILEDARRVKLVGFYFTLLLLSSIFVTLQIYRNAVTNTTTRKVFHVFIILVYLPGLWYQCTILYMGSTIILALLVLLETARSVELKPIYVSLNQAVSCFLDEKDSGSVALTPLYLLIGCSLPMWLHPTPCDLTDSSGFDTIKLMAGVLSVGIGDTMASVCGYYFGLHKWPSSHKSVEGTVASIATQAGVIYMIQWMGYLHLNTRRTAIVGVAIVIDGLIEAKTDQIDNLVLPLITYIILGTI